MPPPSKRRKTTTTAEVVFDPAARQEYLTGFHKRKQARIKHAQEIAVKREKEEKRRDREELKKQREKNLEEHVKAVNESMKYMNGLDGLGSDAEEKEEEEEEGWTGIEEDSNDKPAEDDEYVDEDQYATVTVEAVDITRDGFVTHGDSDDEEEEEAGSVQAEDKVEEVVAAEKPGNSKSKRRPWSKEKPGDSIKSKRKKSRNFKYESKEERKLNRTRDRAKRKAHAVARKAKKG